MGSSDRLVWDTTTVLESLGAAEVALWIWEPEVDRLRFTGAARALGLPAPWVVFLTSRVTRI